MSDLLPSIDLIQRYRHNAFRITELSITATSRIIPIPINTHSNVAHFLVHNNWILLGHPTNLFHASQQASTICS